MRDPTGVRHVGGLLLPVPFPGSEAHALVGARADWHLRPGSVLCSPRIQGGVQLPYCYVDAVTVRGLPMFLVLASALFLVRGFAQGCVAGSPSSLLDILQIQASGPGSLLPHLCRCSCAAAGRCQH